MKNDIALMEPEIINTFCEVMIILFALLFMGYCLRGLFGSKSK